MGLSIRTHINEIDETSCNREVPLSTVLISAIEGNDYSLNYVDKKRINITTDNNTILRDIFEGIGIDKDKVNFIFINCQSVIQSPEDVIKPVNFDLRLSDGTEINIKTSQFQLVDITDLAFDLFIDGVELETGEKAVLEIIIGGKTE